MKLILFITLIAFGIIANSAVTSISAEPALVWSKDMSTIKNTTEVSLNDKVSFVCRFDTELHKKDLQVRWFFKTTRGTDLSSTKPHGLRLRPLEGGNFLHKIKVENKAGLMNVTIFDIESKDLGFYTCSVTNTEKGEEISFTYELKGIGEWKMNLPPDLKPSLDNNPIEQKIFKNTIDSNLDFNQNSTTCAGHNFTFHCGVIPGIGMNVDIGKLPAKINLTASYSDVYNSCALIATSRKQNESKLKDLKSRGISEHSTLAVEHTITTTLGHTGAYICFAYPYEGRKINWKYMFLTVRPCDNAQANPLGNRLLPNYIIPATVLIGCLFALAAVLTLFLWYRKRLRDRKQPLKKRVVVLKPSEFYQGGGASGTAGGKGAAAGLLVNADSVFLESGCVGGGKSITPPLTMTPALHPPEIQIQCGRRAGHGGYTSGGSTTKSWSIRRRLMSSTSASSAGGVVSMSGGVTYQLPIDENWELPRDRLALAEKTGEGAFGLVYLGEYRDLRGSSPGVTQVAVKMLKVDFSEEDLTDLVKEMEVMKLIGAHQHIIQLYGTCTQGGPLHVLMEYAPYGNLRDFLRERRTGTYGMDQVRQLSLPHPNVTYQDMLQFSFQVAKGMEYLALRSIVHRDLAARNVLVGKDFTMKIADFGLTRSITDYYKKQSDGRLPVKWMAPEALFDRTYTTKTDVWAYGIALWEIGTFGGSPYPSVPVEELFKTLRAGYRNERPAIVQPALYDLMCRCWRNDPMDRPCFSTIVSEVDALFQESTTDCGEYLDMSLKDENSKASIDPTLFKNEEPIQAAPALPPKQGIHHL